MKALHRLSMLVAVKVGENVGVQFTDIHPSESIKLIRGSAYGEDRNAVQTSKPLPNLGYFEMVNKSKEFFCIKVLRKGGDQKFEVPRPSYIAGTVRLFCFCPSHTLIKLSYLIALRYICSPCISQYFFNKLMLFHPTLLAFIGFSVPPGGSVHAFFNDEEVKDEDRNDLEIILLHKNPNSVPADLSSVFYDTTLMATTNKISACAKVEAFKNVIFHSIVSKNKNVLLKYKGGGSIIARIGNSVQRVGIIGAILGNRHAKGIIDFGTNIQRIETVFSAAS